VDLTGLVAAWFDLARSPSWLEGKADPPAPGKNTRQVVRLNAEADTVTRELEVDVKF
jgi:hypothetical protein